MEHHYAPRICAPVVKSTRPITRPLNDNPAWPGLAASALTMETIRAMRLCSYVNTLHVAFLTTATDLGPREATPIHRPISKFILLTVPKGWEPQHIVKETVAQPLQFCQLKAFSIGAASISSGRVALS